MTAPAISAALLAFLLFAAGAAPARAGEFEDCLAQLRGAAGAKGIDAQTFDGALAGVEPDGGVLDLMQNQPELKAPIWEYLAGLVDERRVTDGRAELVRWAPTLEAVEREYGVDRYTLVALWGVESNFGRITGRRALVRSLATVSCFGHRQRFFRGELFATLQILQAGDIPAASLKGSWAGAFGQTQFMPTTFVRVAVDFDGDGRRDIVGSVPDALASTANYLKQAGWVSSQIWGYEVRLPKGYKGPSGRQARQSIEQWRNLGLRRIDGEPITGEGQAALLLPAGVRGPAFIVFRNFDAIHAYNNAESYALAIAHLSDRLRGAGPFQTAWPTDDPGLTRAQRMALQERLIERGYDVGVADGVIGPRTVAAIREFQRAAGLPVDGYPGQRVLKALQAPAAR